jgi:hypothetical protein
MGRHNNGLIILTVLVAGLLFPGTGAVFPGGHEVWPIVTAPNLNASGIDVTNSTIPADFPTHQVPVRIEVMISETLIPGPKGEMQAGPRSIDPAALLTLVVAIIAASAGMWYLTKRRPQEPDGGDEENRE